MIRKIGILLDSRQRRLSALLAVGVVFAAILELVAIGAIPAFVVLLHDPGRVLRFLPDSALTRLILSMDLRSVVLGGAVLLAGLFVSKNIYVVALNFAEALLFRDIIVKLSDRLFGGYLHSPYTFHLQRNPAQLIRNIADTTAQAVAHLRSALLMLREGLVLAIVFSILLVVDPSISLLVFAFLSIPASCFYLGVRGTLSRRGELAQGHRGRRIQVINQGLGAIKDAKILGRETYLIDLLRRETLGAERHDLYTRVITSMPRPFLEVIGIGAVLLVTVIFVLLNRPLEHILPILAVLAVGVVRLVPAFNAITASLTGIRYSRPALNLICEELETVETQASATAKRTTTAARPTFCTTISLRDVDYRYPGAATGALKGITLTIESGKAVAFIGPSGAGKSTLVDVILGLLTPTRGEIDVDGHNIEEDLSSWQQQIGYIPQDIYLIDDSIARNIAFGLKDEDINGQALTRAAETAQLGSFLATLPKGLNTVVGNRGIRLSGGQRQRIGIARALYNEPRVLVMDEATNALDNETEREVVRAINQLRGDRTIIMIAHRLTTVIGCDRVYLLEAGKIKDAGSYVELARRHKHLRLRADTGAPQLA